MNNSSVFTHISLLSTKNHITIVLNKFRQQNAMKVETLKNKEKSKILKINTFLNKIYTSRKICKFVLLKQSF